MCEGNAKSKKEMNANSPFLATTHLKIEKHSRQANDSAQRFYCHFTYGQEMKVIT